MAEIVKTRVREVEGELVFEAQVRIGGKLFWSTQRVERCAECGKQFGEGEIPLILFVGEGRLGAVSFCWECARKLGILNLFVR